jgi:hypothetical protein
MGLWTRTGSRGTHDAHRQLRKIDGHSRQISSNRLPREPLNLAIRNAFASPEGQAQGKGRPWRRGCNDTERQLVRDRMFGVVLSLARKNRFCPCGHLLVPTESVGAKKPAWNPNSAKITGEVSSWDQYESLMLPCGLALLR